MDECVVRRLALGLGERTAFLYASEEIKVGDPIMTLVLFIANICRTKLLQNAGGTVEIYLSFMSS